MLRAWVCSIGVVAVSTFAVRASADDIQFNRDIRPILSETCFRCHGPDSAARKADLRFDRREVAVKLGAIVPGKPDKSEMITRIFSDDPDEQMPPPSSHKSLTADAEGFAQAVDRRRGRISAALVVHRAQAARTAGREERRLGSKPDRSVHHWPSWSKMACSRRPRPIAARSPAACRSI